MRLFRIHLVLANHAYVTQVQRLSHRRGWRNATGPNHSQPKHCTLRITHRCRMTAALDSTQGMDSSIIRTRTFQAWSRRVSRLVLHASSFMKRTGLQGHERVPLKVCSARRELCGVSTHGHLCGDRCTALLIQALDWLVRKQSFVRWRHVITIVTEPCAHSQRWGGRQWLCAASCAVHLARHHRRTLPDAQPRAGLKALGESVCKRISRSVRLTISGPKFAVKTQWEGKGRR